MGQDGTTIGRQKLQALRDNSNYFRMRLQEIGLHVLGQYDSPVLPVMLFEPGKIMNFTRECYKRGLAVVVVGFPAVPLVMSRARFCVSAAHTRAQLDQAVMELTQVARICRIRYKLHDVKQQNKMMMMMKSVPKKTTIHRKQQKQV
jgi:serine palmitoyltransferase